MTTNEKCIETCNSLLRGERSAVETYDKVLEKFGDDPRFSDLTTIRSDHSDSVATLEQNVLGMGGKPDTDSGAWGAFANAVQLTANLFGEESALESLEEGEEHGKASYEKALEDAQLLPECAEMISTELLPKIHQHIALLESLEEAA